MRKIGITFTLIFLIYSNNSFGYDGWSTGVIESLRLQEGKTYVIQINRANPNKCEKTNYLYLPDNNNEFTKRANAMLLAAYAAGKKVSLALTGCTGGTASGSTGYPIITEVWVK